jgi:hypothetical protein
VLRGWPGGQRGGTGRRTGRAQGQRCRGPFNSELAAGAMGDNVGQGGASAHGAVRRLSRRRWSEDREGPTPRGGAQGATRPAAAREATRTVALGICGPGGGQANCSVRGQGRDGVGRARAGLRGGQADGNARGQGRVGGVEGSTA